MKRTLPVMAALAAVIGATAVWSQGGPRGPGGPGGPGGPRGMMSCPAMAVMPPPAGMLDRIANELQLTDTETAKLEKVITKGDESIQPLSKKAADVTRALRDALLASDFDVQKVKDLAAAAEKAEAAVINASIEEWAKIREVLTADQVASLRDMMTMRRGGPGQGPGGPPPGGGGFGPPPGADGPGPPPPPE